MLPSRQDSHEYPLGNAVYTYTFTNNLSISCIEDIEINTTIWTNRDLIRPQQMAILTRTVHSADPVCMQAAELPIGTKVRVDSPFNDAALNNTSQASFTAALGVSSHLLVRGKEQLVHGLPARANSAPEEQILSKSRSGDERTGHWGRLRFFPQPLLTIHNHHDAFINHQRRVTAHRHLHYLAEKLCYETSRPYT